jgi:hypothetical protein
VNPLPHTVKPKAKRRGDLRDTLNDLRSTPSRIRISLVRWFRQSTLRVLVLEILHFPLRMSACVTTPYIRRGVTIFAANRDRSMGNLAQESKYQDACTRYIQELMEKLPWAVALDLEVAAQAHRAGALWIRDTLGNETHSTEHIQPSGNASTTGKDTAQ